MLIIINHYVVCRIKVMSGYKYKTIYVNPNSTHLIKWVELLNSDILISCWVRIKFVSNVKNKKLPALTN